MHTNIAYLLEAFPLCFRTPSHQVEVVCIPYYFQVIYARNVGRGMGEKQTAKYRQHTVALLLKSLPG